MQSSHESKSVFLSQNLSRLNLNSNCTTNSTDIILNKLIKPGANIIASEVANSVKFFHILNI